MKKARFDRKKVAINIISKFVVLRIDWIQFNRDIIVIHTNTFGHRRVAP